MGNRNITRPTEVCGELYKVRKMAKSLSKHHCYFSMLLIQDSRYKIQELYSQPHAGQRKEIGCSRQEHGVTDIQYKYEYMDK